MFTFGPATWAWISTPPAMTVRPVASMTFGFLTAFVSTILPSFMATSATSPLIPSTGSKTKPFLIRYSVIPYIPLISLTRARTRVRNSSSVIIPSGASTTFLVSIGTLSIR